MSILFSGLIHVTGSSDVGKTTFALECGAQPENIVFLDSDIKGKSVADQIIGKNRKFAMYRDLVLETKGLREIAYHDYVMKIIDEILNHKGDIDAIIFDTFSQFESTFKPVVSKNPSKFREYWSPMGQIRGGEEWQEAQRYEGEVINRLLQKTKLLIITSHLKPYRIGQKEISGKFIPRCQKPIEEKSMFRLWLMNNPSGRPVPQALVLKRLSDRRITENGIRTVNILPRKLVPLENESSLWDTVARYWNEPFGDRIPFPEETPNEYELSILEGTLTPDQKVALRLVLADSETELAATEEVGLTEKNADVMDAIRSYIAEHPDYKNDEVLKNVEGATVPLIIKAKMNK